LYFFSSRMSPVSASAISAGIDGCLQRVGHAAFNLPTLGE
jgi:hypothetical protein